MNTPIKEAYIKFMETLIYILYCEYFYRFKDTLHYYTMEETNKQPIDRVEQMRSIQEQALELFKKKNTDYGDAFATYGPVGVIVRIGDKIQRLSSVTKNGVSLVNDENLKDTLIDLHNYSAMALMLLSE